jgi:hypothetical protein
MVYTVLELALGISPMLQLYQGTIDSKGVGKVLDLGAVKNCFLKKTD